MIKIEKVDVYGFEAAIRGLRNPLESWSKSDSFWTHIENPETLQTANFEYFVGGNDLALMKKLSKAGSDHAKFLRFIDVTCDITAPLYWWKEFDTYRVGVEKNSCSTMHKIHAKEFTLDDFSEERLFDNLNPENPDYLYLWHSVLTDIIWFLNGARKAYIETKDKQYWEQMIQLLPSSYNQKRTVKMSYQAIKNMYHARKTHKLKEWRDFCAWAETLPYFKEICIEV